MLQWEDLADILIVCYICRVAVGLFGISIKQTQKANEHRGMSKTIEHSSRLSAWLAESLKLEKPVPATASVVAQKQWQKKGDYFKS